MKLQRDGTVRDDRLHLRLNEKQVNELYYLLLAASIYLHGDSLYEEELDFCRELLNIVEWSRRMRINRRK